MTEQVKTSLFDVFASSQETFEEAKKKSSEESSKRASYLRFSNDGTYAVRILPLAPVINAEGKALPLERKGYEYPLRSLILKIEDSSNVVNGKPKITFVNVCNAQYAFPTLKSDLIDLYVKKVCELHSDDAALCKKLRESSFNGGLKWDSNRCMYVIDCDNPGNGLQILQLSYPQYKELEDRKLDLWNKLIKKNGNTVKCPISSIDSAYPVEIKRTTENKKTKYTFTIDTVSGVQELDEEMLQKLLDQPRLPEVLYRYTRFHLEATIAFLTQLDKKYSIDIMSNEEIKECIEQIKMLLPADDQSHFTLGVSSDANGESTENDLDALWDKFDELVEDGLDDKSAEGQELRTSIKEYIADHELEITITRNKSNEDLLNEIEKALGNTDEEPEEKDEEPEASDPDPVEEEKSVEPEEEKEPESPAPVRTRERNDDTNEPAARPSRRSARPQRRR